MDEHDTDEDEILPRVCDESRLPAHIRQAETMPPLTRYVEAVQARDAALDPALRQRNEVAYMTALNSVLQNMGLDRRHTTVAVEPASPHQPAGSGGIVFRGNPLAWIKRLFRRGA